MAHITITYHQNDATEAEVMLRSLQTRFTIKEVPSKQCLQEIPGLVSRSFNGSPEMLSKANLEPLLQNAPVWIKCGVKTIDEPLDIQFKKSDTYALNKFSCGYFATNMNYMWSKGIQNIHSLQWKADITKAIISITANNNDKTLEMKLASECLDKYFVVVTNSGEMCIILPIIATPRCYTALHNCQQRYSRRLDFGKIDESCLADTSALCLHFSNKKSLEKCKLFLIHVLKLDMHLGSVVIKKMSNQAPAYNYEIFNFWSCYTFQKLLTLGYRIKQKITCDIFSKIHQISNISNNEQYPNHQCYRKLIAIYHRAKRNRFFDIRREFDNIPPVVPGIVMDKYVYVPRIYLTPYTVYPLPIKPMRGNRVLRQKQHFGPDEHFCRVIIRDVDLGQPQKDFMEEQEQWIKNLITGETKIMVGHRQYQFLLCSNSQLRDRSFWFHAAYNDCEAHNIRQWMGDFSKEKCVGSYIARMALSLTGTTETITLLPSQIECVADISDRKHRKFTDGVGKISPEALRQVFLAYNPEIIEDDYMPCVIQARLNGIKGIFVLAPDLADRGILVQYRPSQEKFTATNNVLEVVKHSSSSMAFLNRQVIVLLENMGVPKEIFLKLQNKTRLNISMSLLANKSAQRTLEQNVRSYDWERMRKSGLNLTKEPFARSLLLMLAQERLRKLKEKSHAQIPLSDGRMLFGTVDETNSLKYGQVFIQLRNLDGQRQIIRDRQILVTKNPAHFPGDIRILQAVDRPALHHLWECIVFPAEGERPHPNEISGSDLDGDEYWVCWNEDLVQCATQQHAAANFDAAEKSKHEGEITISVISDFLHKYLTCDALGPLSNLHLACSTLHGVNHQDSLQLAGNISQVVDFPKTGVLPENLKSIRIRQYPDFMENKHKESFVSDKSLGHMYRQVKEVWTKHSQKLETMEGQQIPTDAVLLIEGRGAYIIEAKTEYEFYSKRIDLILSTYNLKNEYELITGCHSCPAEERQNNDSAETASLEFRELLREMRTRFASNRLTHSEKLCKASAWYHVAYEEGTNLSFAWIMDGLMSDIVKHKQIPQEDHQAWKQIGQKVVNLGYGDSIDLYASRKNINIEECAGLSKAEQIGCKFLKVIDGINSHGNAPQRVHDLLITLHEIALDTA
ncbi:unnamed protein product [Adineta ricciae]|uniref:RNA-dependent RNA polymerase n=1 Tax=Adineta ricciae TaxID=249248 RepID=A0A815B6V8_ADIRI|nr:unnamed protein product [Adineta ricciae]CAF1266660.1 unnamed protein product [Adineta ricciae]